MNAKDIQNGTVKVGTVVLDPRTGLGYEVKGFYRGVIEVEDSNGRWSDLRPESAIWKRCELV